MEGIIVYLLEGGAFIVLLGDRRLATLPVLLTTLWELLLLLRSYGALDEAAK